MISIVACRKFLSQIALEVESGTMDAAKGAKLAYIISNLKGVIEASEFEERLSRLEKEDEHKEKN